MSLLNRVLLILIVSACALLVINHKIYNGKYVELAMQQRTWRPVLQYRARRNNMLSRERQAASQRFLAGLQNRSDGGASAQDAAFAARMSEELRAQNADTTIVLIDGSRVSGAILSETAEYINFRVHFGHSGSIVRKIFRNHIGTIESRENVDEPITNEETTIRREFPNFHFFRSGSYSLFTDQDYFKITASVEILNNLYREFVGVFGPGISWGSGPRASRAYVLIFGNQLEYLEYARRSGVGLAQSSGFYSPERNRLAFFNFFEAPQFRQTQEYLARQRAKIAELKQQNASNKNKNYDTYQYNLRLIESYEAELQSYERNETFTAKENNITTLRHEAAHQLSYNLGLITHPYFDTWLLEGIACYCEAPYMGQISRGRVIVARNSFDSKTHIPLRRLFELSEGGLFYTQTGAAVSMAYAQSWLLVYWMMQPARVERFFAYIKDVQQMRRPAPAGERIRIFEQALGVSLDALEIELADVVKKL